MARGAMLSLCLDDNSHWTYTPKVIIYVSFTLYLESVSTQTLLEALCPYKPVSVALCVRSIPILHQQPSSSLYLLALILVSLVR